MDKKLIQEINKIKRLSNLNESQLNEGVITDIIHFFEIASDEILQTDTVKKLKNYFQSIIPGLGGNISNETEIEKDKIQSKLDSESISFINCKYEIPNNYSYPILSHSDVTVLPVLKEQNKCAKH
jgi:hypothetical protein